MNHSATISTQVKVVSRPTRLSKFYGASYSPVSLNIVNGHGERGLFRGFTLCPLNIVCFTILLMLWLPHFSKSDCFIFVVVLI